LSKSLDLQKKARSLIPGMTQLLSKRPDQFAPGVWPGYYKKASGAEVWDLDGNRYVDMSISGIGANVLGYADPDVDAAVISAIRDGVSSSLNCPEEVALAERLCDLHPGMEMARFARSGGEIAAMAVRIARAATGRSTVAFCGYHGWHDWYLSANLADSKALDGHLIPGLAPTGIPRELKGTSIPFRFNDCANLTQVVADHEDSLAAIIMEPIRDAPPSDGFKTALTHCIQKTGAVLIVDEISSGFRLTTGGAYQLYGLQPDMVIFSKALGNGYPISAVIGKQAVMSAAEGCFISSTNWTERVGPTAALAMIEKHASHRVHQHLVRCGEEIQAGWKKAASEAGLDISLSGIAPMSHFAFDHADAPSIKSLFVQLMLESGFLASNLYYAMYAHTPSHIESYLSAVTAAFTKIRTVLDSESLASTLLGGPARNGFLRLN